MKKPKAGEAQGAPAAVPAGSACAAGGSAAPAHGSVPAFLQAGQVRKCSAASQSVKHVMQSQHGEFKLQQDFGASLMPTFAWTI